MSNRKRKWRKERWYKCPKRNGLLVPPQTCEKECGDYRNKCHKFVDYIERKVRESVIR